MNIGDFESLDGEIKRGFGVANQSIPKQMKLLSEYAPRIQNCHPATLNVELHKELHIKKWPITTSPCTWSDKFPDYQEVFRLLPINFIYQESTYPAWLYLSDGAHHRVESTKRYFEVITQKLNLSESNLCSIIIDRTYIQNNTKPPRTKTKEKWTVNWQTEE